jgi:hypothetical protein
MRKLLLPALAACALLAAGAPVASAHKAHAAATPSLSSKLSKAAGAIKGLEKTAKALFNNDAGQTAAIGRNGDSITSLGAKVQSILDGVPTIVTNLTQAGDGLKALQAVLTDTVSPALTSLGTAVQVTLPGAIASTAAALQSGFTASLTTEGTARATADATEAATRAAADTAEAATRAAADTSLTPGGTFAPTGTANPNTTAPTNDTTLPVGTIYRQVVNATTVHLFVKTVLGAANWIAPS